MSRRRHHCRKMGQPFSEEYFPYVKPFRILMVGLCDSGKTSLLYRDVATGYVIHATYVPSF